MQSVREGIAASPGTGMVSQGQHKAGSRGLSVTLAAVRGVQVDHLQLCQAAATAALLPDDSHLEEKREEEGLEDSIP